MLLGCVELSEQGDPQEVFPALREMDQSGLAAEKARHAELTNALKLLDKYAPAKKSLLAPLPEAGMGELLDESTLDADVALAEQLAELEERIRRATAEEGAREGGHRGAAALGRARHAAGVPRDRARRCQPLFLPGGAGHGGGRHGPGRGRAGGAALPRLRRQGAALRGAHLPARGAGRRHGGAQAAGLLAN